MEAYASASQSGKIVIICSLVIIILGAISTILCLVNLYIFGLIISILTVLLGCCGLFGISKNDKNLLLGFVIGCAILWCLQVLEIIFLITSYHDGNAGIWIITILNIIFYTCCCWFGWKSHKEA
eukprot:TRINITY_DN379_c0_g1_i3.p1 TRINITY_DN379_c0_g1~~TRINITY_DN379_c0_g1_i3.p1  ORF type:complete len:124 (-),score=23.04 TRINITY_DN379_c0_g1_i3:79-450(-)